MLTFQDSREKIYCTTYSVKFSGEPGQEVEDVPSLGPGQVPQALLVANRMILFAYPPFSEQLFSACAVSMDKLKRALTGREQPDDEERGFVAQVVAYYVYFSLAAFQNSHFWMSSVV